MRHYVCVFYSWRPTHPTHRVYAVFYDGLDQTFQSGRQCVQLMAPVRAHWNFGFYCFRGWFSFFLRRVRPRCSLMVPVVAHTIDGRFNGTTGPLDPSIEGSRLPHVSESTDTSRSRVVWTIMNTSSRCGVPFHSSVADDQSHVGNIAYIGDLFFIVSMQCPLNCSELRNLAREVPFTLRNCPTSFRVCETSPSPCQVRAALHKDYTAHGPGLSPSTRTVQRPL